MNIQEDLKSEILRLIQASGPMNDQGQSFLTEKTYKEVKDFKVEIFPNESQHRGRAHCKVTTDEGAVSVDLNTFEIIAGDAGKWNFTIKKVIETHKKGLLLAWEEMRPDDQRLEKNEPDKKPN